MGCQLNILLSRERPRRRRRQRQPQDHKRGVPVVRPSAHCAHQHAVPRVAASVLCAPLLLDEQPGVGHAVVMSESTWCRPRPHLKLEALPDNVRSRPPWPHRKRLVLVRETSRRGARRFFLDNTCGNGEWEGKWQGPSGETQDSHWSQRPKSLVRDPVRSD